MTSVSNKAGIASSKAHQRVRASGEAEAIELVGREPDAGVLRSLQPRWSPSY